MDIIGLLIGLLSLALTALQVIKAREQVNWKGVAGKPVISDLINIRDVTLNSNDLREWQAHMGFKSALAASKALGVTDKTYRGWIKAKEHLVADMRTQQQAP